MNLSATQLTTFEGYPIDPDGPIDDLARQVTGYYDQEIKRASAAYCEGEEA